MAHALRCIWVDLMEQTHTAGHPMHTLATGLLLVRLRETRGSAWVAHHRRMIARALFRLEKRP